jgi:hypothetical protein
MVLILSLSQSALSSLSNEAFELKVPSALKFGDTLQVIIHLRNCNNIQNSNNDVVQAVNQPERQDTKKVCIGLHHNDDGSAFEINIERDALWCDDTLHCNAESNEIELPELGLKDLAIGNYAVRI